MSASSKKKLRNEQSAAKLTERQLAEQQEAKKLKIYTAVFAVVLVALVIIAAVFGVNQAISNSGVREKNTVAMTIGEHEISNAELNYYFIDTVRNFYSTNSSYAYVFGLNTNQPLDEQVWNESTGETWADYFLDSAKETAHSVYAMADAAAAAGHSLTEDEAANVESVVNSMNIYAGLSGYANADDYLKSMYGSGADLDSYKAYVEKSLLADSYYAAYGESLTYEDSELRAKEAENFSAYSSYSYNYYYVSANRVLEGGTTAEDGTTTYSDEETAASIAAAEEAAKALAEGGYTTVEELDAAIAALSINAESETAVSSTAYDNYPYSSFGATLYSDWIVDEARVEGDMTYIANSSTTTAEDGTETTTVYGYYVLFFRGSTDNAFPMKNVRHILVSFEGGTTDEMGTTTYSDDEKAAAHTAAVEILKEWKAGAATEESFATLATLKSTDTGSAANGGLYENVYPGQMVPAFNDWCYDEARKPGDTDIVETNYGFHVMYFVGDSEMSYRDFQISNELASAEMEAWYADLLAKDTVVDGDYSYIMTDTVMYAGY